ncbi:DUF3678 domain-containing protein [Alicyclobacillus sp. TC]|nr:DUF3678 domain-containing protein [Alicyclobacillus sp. TC]
MCPSGNDLSSSSSVFLSRKFFHPFLNEWSIGYV